MNAFGNILQSQIDPLIGGGVAAIACALILLCVILARKQTRFTTRIWSVAFLAIAAFFGIWNALGLCEADGFTFIVCETALAAAGTIVLQRDRLADWLGRREREASGERRFSDWRLPSVRKGFLSFPLRDTVFLLVAAVFSLLALETPDNADWEAIPLDLKATAFLMILAAMAALYFLLQRRGIGAMLVAVVCIAFGAVQNFLDLFKNAAFLPSDILAWQTAAAVSGGYTFTINEPLMRAIAYAAVALCALAFIVPARREKPAKAAKTSGDTIATGIENSDFGPNRNKRAGRVKRFFFNIACFLVLGGGLVGLVTFVDFQEQFDIHLNYWDLRNSYHSHTFTLAFTAAAQDLRIEQPEGYSDERAQELQETLAAQYDAERGAAHAKVQKQFSGTKPNVIAVMNETYADLSVYEQLHDGYTGTFVTQRLKDADVSGMTSMSVFGGGTCNSEYEFLAGSSMDFLGRGMYPYQQFGLDNIDALGKQFREMGYQTAAIHPNYPGNWNREFVYAQTGFNESYFIYDFDGARMFHDKVSDGATYDKALDIIAASDEPAFVLDVTMQNHGGYDSSTIAEADLTHVKPDFGSDEETAQLNEYLSCIAASDRDLEALLKQLKTLDEPVAVVFFGDHQPSIARTINDTVFPDEDELVHATRIMKTPYFLWTNYDLAGSTPETGLESSANYLGAQFIEAIGGELSDYQKALLVLHETVHAVNVNGYEDASGVWHAADEDPTANPEAREAYDQLRTLHYLNIVRKL